jgi:hypothetical protein
MKETMPLPKSSVLTAHNKATDIHARYVFFQPAEDSARHLPGRECLCYIALHRS